MLVPLYARDIAAVAGGLLVLAVWSSAIGALVVTRAVGRRLTRMADKIVTIAFRTLNEHLPDYRRRDRVMSFQAAAILVAQLAAWLGTAFAGFTLLLWPFEHDLAGAFTAAGSSLFTLGFDVPPGTRPAVVVFRAPDPAHHPHPADRLPAHPLLGVQAAGNRGRAAELARRPLLGAGTACPHALRARVGRVDHRHNAGAVRPVGTLGLGRCGKPHHVPAAGPVPSPQPLSSWVTALLAVLDSAALYLSLSPKAAPVVPARLCLRSGFQCFARVARAMSLRIPDEPDPDAGISLTYEEFLDAVERMRKVNFPIERDPPTPGRTRRLARQLRAGRVPDRVRPGRGARPLVGPAHAPHRAHRPDPPGARTAAEEGVRRAAAAKYWGHERSALYGIGRRRLPAGHPLQHGLRRDPEQRIRRLMTARRRCAAARPPRCGPTRTAARAVAPGRPG